MGFLPGTIPSLIVPTYPTGLPLHQALAAGAVAVIGGTVLAAVTARRAAKAASAFMSGFTAVPEAQRRINESGAPLLTKPFALVGDCVGALVAFEMARRLQQAGGPNPVALVVGGGLAGLAAALELVDAGHEVTLLEARPTLGGAVQTLPERGGQRRGWLLRRGGCGFAAARRTSCAWRRTRPMPPKRPFSRKAATASA